MKKGNLEIGFQIKLFFLNSWQTKARENKTPIITPAPPPALDSKKWNDETGTKHATTGSESDANSGQRGRVHTHTPSIWKKIIISQILNTRVLHGQVARVTLCQGELSVILEPESSEKLKWRWRRIPVENGHTHTHTQGATILIKSLSR